MAARGKDGKFVEDPNSFDKTPFGVKMTPAMKEWVRTKGGSEFIRQLIEKEMHKEQRSRSSNLTDKGESLGQESHLISTLNQA